MKTRMIMSSLLCGLSLYAYAQEAAVVQDMEPTPEEVLGGKVEVVEARLGGVELRNKEMEGRVKGLEEAKGGIEKRLECVEQSDKALGTRLKGLEDAKEGIEKRLEDMKEGVEKRLDAGEAHGKAVDSRMAGFGEELKTLKNRMTVEETQRQMDVRTLEGQVQTNRAETAGVRRDLTEALRKQSQEWNKALEGRTEGLKSEVEGVKATAEAGLAQEKAAREDSVRELGERMETVRRTVSAESAEALSATNALLNAELKELGSGFRAGDAELQEALLREASALKDSIAHNRTSLMKRTGWLLAFCMVLVGMSVGVWYCLRREFLQRKETSELDGALLGVLKALGAEEAQPIAKTETSSMEALVLKIADELTRIEVNLSKMDKEVKGHKQLTKAVERMKNNFLANGYEIVPMLGQSYREGMRAVANFVPDETLPQGAQIITGIVKPQVNFNGKMIQAAQITVSQNI